MKARPENTKKWILKKLREAEKDSLKAGVTVKLEKDEDEKN